MTKFHSGNLFIKSCEYEYKFQWKFQNLNFENIQNGGKYRTQKINHFYNFQQNTFKLLKNQIFGFENQAMTLII